MLLPGIEDSALRQDKIKSHLRSNATPWALVITMDHEKKRTGCPSIRKMVRGGACTENILDF